MNPVFIQLFMEWTTLFSSFFYHFFPILSFLVVSYNIITSPPVINDSTPHLLMAHSKVNPCNHERVDFFASVQPSSSMFDHPMIQFRCPWPLLTPKGSLPESAPSLFFFFLFYYSVFYSKEEFLLDIMPLKRLRPSSSSVFLRPFQAYLLRIDFGE